MPESPAHSPDPDQSVTLVNEPMSSNRYQQQPTGGFKNGYFCMHLPANKYIGLLLTNKKQENKI